MIAKSRRAVRLLICPDLINNVSDCRSDCVCPRCYLARLQIRYDIYRDPQPLQPILLLHDQGHAAPKFTDNGDNLEDYLRIYEAQKLLICQSRQIDFAFDCFGLR